MLIERGLPLGVFMRTVDWVNQVEKAIQNTRSLVAPLNTKPVVGSYLLIEDR